MRNTLTLIGAIAIAIAVIAAAAIIVKKYTDKCKTKKCKSDCDCDCGCYPYGDIDPFEDGFEEDDCMWDEVPVEDDDGSLFGLDATDSADSSDNANTGAAIDDDELPF